jgi:hypothetical protein
MNLADGVLTAAMKHHFATQEEAVAVVWPFLRAWELDRALACGRREVHFKFVRSEIRDPEAVASMGNAGDGESGTSSTERHPADVPDPVPPGAPFQRRAGTT